MKQRLLCTVPSVRGMCHCRCKEQCSCLEGREEDATYAHQNWVRLKQDIDEMPVKKPNLVSNPTARKGAYDRTNLPSELTSRHVFPTPTASTCSSGDEATLREGTLDSQFFPAVLQIHGEAGSTSPVSVLDKDSHTDARNLEPIEKARQTSQRDATETKKQLGLSLHDPNKQNKQINEIQKVLNETTEALNTFSVMSTAEAVGQRFRSLVPNALWLYSGAVTTRGADEESFDIDCETTDEELEIELVVATRNPKFEALKKATM